MIVSSVNSGSYLNTSHVILYLVPGTDNFFADGHLNTSHVILYPRPPVLYLSLERHLNTSHVILYQGIRSGAENLPEFKYISCYSLSEKGDTGDTGPQGFKYISCYSLSSLARSSVNAIYNLNTSHVILYPEVYRS